MITKSMIARLTLTRSMGDNRCNLNVTVKANLRKNKGSFNMQLKKETYNGNLEKGNNQW